MGDDFGFFDDDDENRAVGTQKLRGTRSAHSSGYSVRTIRASASRSKLLGRFAACTGVLAIAVGAASAAHELAPNIIDPGGVVPGRYIALSAAVLVALTVVLVIAARKALPRRASHHGVAAAGIITLVLSVLLLILGISVGVLFPQGLIQPRLRDEAPITSNGQMEAGIEQAAGTCESGWNGLDAGGYPGITTIEMCADTRVAFVSFDTETSAAMSKALLKTRVADLLAQYADDERTQGDWRLLSGAQWVAFGDAAQMEALQQLWGGSLEPAVVSAAATE
ncbi:hypothetical protein [Bifidobacterium eulemuris]|uniref:Uncharacterized protein n=1 Tax=Bifidobacterium eulemuris TaxID=1765219 RepID=A0A261FXX9_9BIFI|nr:hypothetical protein [Bifidobacterium eulemuris]OZG64022.1 hypothetical protein BEUL_2288 [Bifidobacterium eulemuris]QOL32382.1 hypothetical protein BE0216_07885 [Bifidobacterium eulemuris]